VPDGGHRPDVSIVTSGHDVADARLHREVRALLAAGLDVEVLGLGDAAAGPPGARVRTRPRTSMLARAVRALVWPWRARGRVLVLLDPDVVPGALLWRRVRRRRVVADVHEDYAALLHDRAWVPVPVRPLLTRLATWCVGLAGHADLTVVADDHVPPTAARCRARLVVKNLPDLGLLPTPRAPEQASGRAVYVGDLRRSRGLDAMVAAVAAAPGWQLDLVGPVSATERERLDGLVRELAVADRVTLHGRMPPREAWQVASAADVGFALLEDTPAFRDAVPTKVYEYLACGLAVIATPLPRVRALLEQSGGGVVVADAPAAAAVLRSWSADADQVVAHRRAARSWALAELGGSPYALLASKVSALGS
jgi:glycosyltransferase involved in cell wall biosynthesis